MKVYAVRQKSTGLFIPRLKTGYKRGGSRLEPSNEREPRIFHSALAARAFLSNWLRGITEKNVAISLEGIEDWGNKVVLQPQRNKADMEIVEFECIEIVRKVTSNLDLSDVDLYHG